MKIQKTMKFSKFTGLNGNRSIDFPHLGRLITSIDDQNLLEHNPILVNDKFEVIDGQHRLMAAMELDTPIYYIVLEGAGLKHAQRLNANTRSWNLKDFMDSYVDLGKKEYVKLKSFVDKFNVSISMGILLLNEDENKDRSGYIKTFKSGKFKVKDWNKGVESANELEALKPYCNPASIINDREFVSAIRTTKEQIKVDKLVKKLRDIGAKIERSANKMGYLRQIEDIYNFKRKDGFRIRLY